ncbi:RAB6-interacting golgin [Rhinatrema bivittatum]|uniref:RAB6-interacting golgin n=1 Tax=Rhinatrema bivittatum TaxID=194408 RepID=UPI00112B172C|nr:RAB6-interacting golgin [Rhinatrema bivittatum]
MAGWAGFSEEELRQLKQQKDLLGVSERSRRPPSLNKTHQQLQREKAVQQQIQRTRRPDGVASLPVEQQLSKPRARPTPQATPAPAREHVSGAPQKEQGVETPRESRKDNQGDPRGLLTEQHLTQEKKEVELREKSRLDQLQLEQRLMEEKNKRKKTLLAKAIAERSKKTQAETVKLKRIQKELQALDDLVSTDVGILRNRIDQACMDYTYAKKRFDKAEVEYIAAKLDLHRKTEIKEQLTEHLCTIIQQNELRKAKKLEELMHQLEVEPDEENLELEIEVDQMLQQQNAENRGQAAGAQINTEKLPQTSEEPQTQKTEGMKERDPSSSVSEQFVENPINNHISPCQSNGKDQEANITLNEIKTESTPSA